MLFRSLFEAAGGRVLILCDEVLNFCNRHRNLTDGFYAFLQNLTVAMTGTTHSAAVISLPRRCRCMFNPARRLAPWSASAVKDIWADSEYRGAWFNLG